MKKLIGTEVLTFIEGDAWVAAWIRRDVVAQGKTESEAINSLLNTIAFEYLLAEAEGDHHPPPTPPDHVVAYWQKRHQECHEEKSDDLIH